MGRDRASEAVKKRTAILASWLGLFAVGVVSACTLALKGWVPFTAHVVCSTAAYLGAMGLGLLAYVGPPEGRKAARESHRVLQILAALLTIPGLAGIFINKMRKGKSIIPYTTHAWLGALVLVLTLVQCLVGLAKYSEALKRGFSSGGSAGTHRILGIATYALSAPVIATGIAHTFGKGPPERMYALIGLTQVAAVAAVLVAAKR